MCFWSWPGDFPEFRLQLYILLKCYCCPYLWRCLCSLFPHQCLICSSTLLLSPSLYLLSACPDCRIEVWKQTSDGNWEVAQSNSLPLEMQGWVLAKDSEFHFEEQKGSPFLGFLGPAPHFLPPSSDQLLYHACPAPTNPTGDLGRGRIDQEIGNPRTESGMRWAGNLVITGCPKWAGKVPSI